MTTHTEATENVWKAIDRERERDRLLRRVSVAAWAGTLGFAAVLFVLGLMSAVEMVRAARAGAVPWMSVIGAVLPVVIPLGALVLLIAVLSTVAIFLRMRSATLHEIQLRLAALEDLLAREHGPTDAE